MAARRLRVFSLLVAVPLLVPSASAEIVAQVEVLPEVQTPKLPRIGLNMGEWSVFGASQFMRNVLKNPGFEGQIDRALVVVAHAGPQGFDDDTSWTGRPDGFWAGAHYEVRSGASAGRSGALSDSHRKGENGLPTFTSQEPTPVLAPGDVVVLSKVNDQNLPTHWQLPRDLPPGQVAVELKDKRPGSPGIRSLALIPDPAEPKRFTPTARVTAYLDALGDRAGKMLPITGRWTLSLWARSDSPQANLRIVLQRAGAPPMLKENRHPPAEWSHLEFSFQGKDDGPNGVLSLELGADGGRLLLDDVSLERADGGDGAFRAEVLTALDKMKPGYLRDWQGQLGDSFENLIAPPFSRRTDRYRPGPEDRYGYSLPEFLDLCKRVGANPWVILPTTLDDVEYQAYGRYLAERIRQDGFSEAVVEFGNENWNMIFRHAGLPDTTRHGLVAQRAFTYFKQGAGDAPIRLAVNGQYVNPNGALKMLDSAPDAQLLAVAPYVLNDIKRSDYEDTPWPLLFKLDSSLSSEAKGVQERKKELAVYEVNLHTTRGDLPLDLRQPIVAGQASGSALAKRLLDAMGQGVRRQCVYNFAQFDFSMEDRSLVRLWGVMRDLGVTQRMRPTGLALTMLNMALPGDAHALRLSGPGSETLAAAAIRRADGWALALVSASAEAQTVHIKLPPDGQAPRTLRKLDAAQPSSSNENQEDVRIVETRLPDRRPLEITVPAWGFVVLTP
jgi:hypothetical protein